MEAGIIEVTSLLVPAALLLAVQQLRLILAHERLRYLDAGSARVVACALSVIRVGLRLVVLMGAESLRREGHAHELPVGVQRGHLPLAVDHIRLGRPGIRFLLSRLVGVLRLDESGLSVGAGLPAA